NIRLLGSHKRLVDKFNGYTIAPIVKCKGNRAVGQRPKHPCRLTKPKKGVFTLHFLPPKAYFTFTKLFRMAAINKPVKKSPPKPLRMTFRARPAGNAVSKPRRPFGDPV